MNRFKRYGALTVCIVAPLLMAADCSGSDQAPAADSDSSSNYKSGSTIPVDDSVYTITGTVVADVGSVTRQVSPAKGDYFGFNGYASGSYFGPVEAGKGFVRLTVQSVGPANDTVRAEQTVILKVTDTKATALLPGDFVTFKCRRQYEAVAAVRDESSFDRDKVATWEMDFCRLAIPTIKAK